MGYILKTIGLIFGIYVLSIKDYALANYNISDLFEAQNKINNLKKSILQNVIVHRLQTDKCPTCLCHAPIKGNKGVKGPKGIQGLQGDKGFPGMIGWRGLPCFNKPRGYEAPLKGYRGEPGHKGPKGIPGIQGRCICSGTSEECMSCPRLAHAKYGQPGLRGDKGDQGPKGYRGDKGVKGPIVKDPNC